MQTLPKSGTYEREAGAVSDILAKANPAEMPAMRASLSFLTSAGAEMAAALARRNQEYDELMAIVTALPPEWVEAAKTGASLPDMGSLRAELELANNERFDLHGQIVERDQQIKGLQDQIGQLQTELLVLPETRARQVEELQAEADASALARASAEDDLKAREAELNDIEGQLADLRLNLMAALSEDAQAEPPPAPSQETIADPRQRRAMRLGALAGAIASLIDRNRQVEEQLGASNARVASVVEEFEAISADRMALGADLQEKVQTLEDQQAEIERLQSHQESLIVQIEELSGQVAQLQAELDETLAAKAQVDEQLQLREGELAELNQQIDSVAQQLRIVLPEDALAPVVPVEEMDEAGQEAEGDEVATRSAAPKMLGLTALAAGVSSAVDLSSQKTNEAAEASGQLAALTEEKAGLESMLLEKEQAIADLAGQVDQLSAQVAGAQAEIDQALAARAELEQELSQRAGQLSELQGQVDGAVSRLLEIVPGEDLPEPEAVAESDDTVEGEGLAVQAVGLAALVSGVARLTDRSRSSVAELDGQVHSLQTALDELGLERANLEAMLADKEQTLAGYNDYVLNLQGQVNELAAQTTSAESALAIREEADAETQAQIEALTAQIEALTAQVETLTAQVADLQAQLDASTAANAELQQALQETQAQLEAAQAELAQIDEESQRALGDKAVRLGVVGAGAAAVAAIKDKEEELAVASEQVLALQSQVDELAGANEQVLALQAKVDELAVANEQLLVLQGQVNELSAAAAEVTSLQNQLEELARSKAELEAQLGELEASAAASEPLVIETRSPTLDLGAATALSEALAGLPAIKTTAASAAIVAGVQPVLSSRIQALTDVAGIGSAYQQRLYNAGVGTYWELSSVPDEDLETVLQIPDLQRARINFDDTRADAYRWAQETNTIGLLWDGDHVDDFETLPGVGKTFEKRLYEAGITTYEQLAECDVERLAEIIKPPPMREVDYDAWKERALQLIAERAADQSTD